MQHRVELAADSNNPCLKEQQMSYKCLSDNGYIQEKCETHFENYKACKKFWGRVTRHRRFNGIVPYLPNIEEREKIKEEYLKQHATK